MEPLTDLLTDENAMTRLGAATVLNRLGWRPGGVDEQAVYLIALQQWQDAREPWGPGCRTPFKVQLAPDTGVKAGAIQSLARIGTPCNPSPDSPCSAMRLAWTPQPIRWCRIGGGGRRAAYRGLK